MLILPVGWLSKSACLQERHDGCGHDLPRDHIPMDWTRPTHTWRTGLASLWRLGHPASPHISCAPSSAAASDSVLRHAAPAFRCQASARPAISFVEGQASCEVACQQASHLSWRGGEAIIILQKVHAPLSKSLCIIHLMPQAGRKPCAGHAASVTVHAQLQPCRTLPCLAAKRRTLTFRDEPEQNSWKAPSRPPQAL